MSGAKVSMWPTDWLEYSIIVKRGTNLATIAQEAIIASLKQELATQKSLASEAKSIRTQLAVSNKDKSKAEAENKRLSASLRDAQSEAKGLSAKLAAARQASIHRADSAPPRGPGSATKGSTAGTRTSAADSIGKDSVQLYALKEELYRDLTDLVVLGVKQADGEIVYDCIQTGRNGSKLFSFFFKRELFAAHLMLGSCDGVLHTKLM